MRRFCDLLIRGSLEMASTQKTVIVTGASQVIGAGVVQAFLARDYDVVGTARSATKSKNLSASDHLVLIDGDIGQFETAQKVAELAIKKFGSIDAVVANAGIFLVQPFTEYTAGDFRTLVSTNLAGFIYVTQLAVKQMQAQKPGFGIRKRAYSIQRRRPRRRRHAASCRRPEGVVEKCFADGLNLHR